MPIKTFVNKFVVKTYDILRWSNMKKNICIVGGDERNYELANLLKKEHFVKVYDENVLDIDKFLYEADCLICGIPFSRDNDTVNAPYISKKIAIERLFLNMRGKTIIAGSVSDNIKDMAKKYDIQLYDFLDDEDFAIYNAIPTAEGAIEIAMRETNYTINSSNCLILGYGRIGKVLADLLDGLHANITIAARKNEDFAWIKARGYNFTEYHRLHDILPSTDILFNTVPSLIIKREELEFMKKDSLIIDLASKPGGIDFKCAEDMNIKAQLALGLPGKVSPKSVAEYMANKVRKVM